MHEISKSGYSILTRQTYQTKPWKNGKGITHDILLLPEGSEHSGFDLRFALSPIDEKGAFSSFPGADRVITVIEGTLLELDFGDRMERLNQYQSLRFDTALAPMGDPVGGPIRVVNVMARRGAWDIVSCEVTTEPAQECGEGELLFLFVLSEGWQVETAAGPEALEPHSSVIVRGKNRINMGRDDQEGVVICARLKQIT